MLDSLELLSIIDIIKNEELYRKKLEELRAADAQLADSRFIAATVEQANKLRDEAEKVLALAKEAEQESKKKVQKAVDDADLKAKKAQESAELRLQEAIKIEKEAKALIDGLKEREQAVDIQNKRNQDHALLLANKEQALLIREAALKQRKQELEEILRKI